MKRVFPSTLIFIAILAGGLLVHPIGAAAVDCDGLGNLTTIFSGTELSDLKPNITIQIEYSWKSLLADKLPCLDYALTLFVGAPNVDAKTVSWGKVGAHDTKTASIRFSINDFKGLGIFGGGISNVSIRTDVQNNGIPPDTLAQSVQGIVVDTRDAQKIYACVAGNNKYACATKPDCSDAVGCGAVSNCQVISDSRLCGQTVPSVTPRPTGSTTGSGGGSSVSGQSGQSVSYTFELPNPVTQTDAISLMAEVSRWIANLALPVALTTILIAGILYLFAGQIEALGGPSATKMIGQAKNALKYAIIGIAIITIGRGFVTLIQSILDLGSSGGSPTQTVGNGTPIPAQTTSNQPPAGTPAPVPAGKPLGSQCADDEDCISPLLCGSTNICRKPGWNLPGDPCRAVSDCRSGLQCDTAVANHQVIDGQILGTCIAPAGN